MGRALSVGGYRDKVFLMTKIDGRTKGRGRAQIDESLNRLLTDRLDLVQFHENIRPDDADRIFAEGGALEAARGGAQRGQGALHRLHRPQGPGVSSAHDRPSRSSTASRSIRCRCRST